MERSEESKQWLLRDQEMRLARVENLLIEYSKLNTTIGNIKVMVADLVIEEKRVDNQMTALRYQIDIQEKKIREINKLLRNQNDPSIINPKESNGDVSNV